MAAGLETAKLVKVRVGQDGRELNYLVIHGVRAAGRGALNTNAVIGL